MRVYLVNQYLIALIGLFVGVVVGLAIGAARSKALSLWDARVSVPLLLGASGAHLVLISAVEPMRQVLFGLYGLALISVVVFAASGWSIWRLGGVLFPAGSIAAYFYFAFPEHQADYVGLFVKLVEVATIASVLIPVLHSRGERSRLPA
jgi:hypothetical protein